ncbi:CobW family GTP-binding protein [Granulicoccus phenolivorans]|uniref:CobW family GTP-binding protein n=1 Tax=Granulicoccus phenolivorans TaxID=266854 RepID=UPI0003FCBB3C|nr:GTP-binding protein [Granulicoccus phenolivorans]
MKVGRRQVPVILISGIQEGAVASASISLQLGLPGAVGVMHTIDAEREILTRVVGDITGVIEHEEINLAHTCITCAIREDIVPTLERLAAQGKWTSIVACLPVTAEANQVCRVLSWAPGNAPHVTVAAVVTALDGATISEDLLGDEALGERGLATAVDDDRGVAEVATAMVEYADVVCLTQLPEHDELALLTALARPRVPLVADPCLLDAPALAAGVHRSRASEGWIDEVRVGPLPPLPEAGVWRLDLHSDRPFHPGRLYEEIETLGSGPRRARGCFWLPTRPDAICAWDSAGGQASVGSTQNWGAARRQTRITVVGLAGDDGHREIEAAFHRCLLTDTEIATRGQVWEEIWDGLEPWLGPIERAA